MAENKSYETMTPEQPQQPPSYSASSGEAALPSYHDIESNRAPPPSYDSLYGRAKAIHGESSGTLDFVKRLVFIIFGTIGFTIFLGFMLALPISMIVMGSLHLDDCPAERYIPIYLLVAGVFGVLRSLITIGRRCCNRNQTDEEEGAKKPNPVESIIDCFMFAWFIAGNVWIYRTKGDFSEDSTADNYCDPTLYWYAFWITTAGYIIMAASCCCCCFCGILGICIGNSSSGQKTTG